VKKIFVKGPVLSQSGYGEQARFALRALRSREDLFDIYIQAIPWGKTGWIWEESEFREWIDAKILKTQMAAQQKQLSIDVSLQITIPNEFEKIAPVNLGYTAGIETTLVSPQWLPKGNEMDKLLVVSEHAKTSFQETSALIKNSQTGEEKPYRLTTSIDVVHETTPRANPEPIENLDLKTDFNFLLVSQFGIRKNFENSITWWIEEFHDQNVGLIIKTNTASNSIMDHERTETALQNIMLKYSDRKCKVYLLHGDLSSGQMTWLYQHEKIKALINISHGEGFGLPMFEAAREALPIIAIGWSGHLDFLRHGRKDYFQKVDHKLDKVQKQAVWKGVIEPEVEWAYADQGSYKMVLRSTKKKWKKAKKTAEELQVILNEKFNEEKLFEGFCNSVLGLSSLKPEPITGISFCIPTHGKRKEKTLLTIKSIKNALNDFPYEIVVCGNTEPFQDLDNIVLVDDKKSAFSGKVGALRNTAASKSKFNTIAWCDDDIILDPNWLEGTLEFSKQNGWFVLGNKILNPDATRHWDRATINPHKLIDYTEVCHSPLIQTAGFFLMRKSIHNQIMWSPDAIALSDRDNKGGIPEDYLLSLKFAESGIKVEFNESATVWHNDPNYTQIENFTLSLQDIKKSTGEDYIPIQDDDFARIVEELS